MLRGLTTTNYIVDDLRAAIDWYTELLGVEPYFVREVDGAPVYVEFRLGDFQHELGFIDRRFAPPHRAGSDTGATLTYWAVDDVEATYERLLSLGATTHEGITERGPGFVTASVVDPFGNVLAVMYNQHYLDIVDSVKVA
ncbi:VOC family protein [Rhodococcus pyridinivorans]|uniref:VOC family protein n=1 Tax=Rhodococcus TaxID=1827 RepID=UPI0002E45FCA|nr:MULTISPECIES: VOC family protein [Rhodococcus]UPK64365.1 VOC family protein [Rhodococcus pyridinivorans]UVT25512.1 VOC family protein [Rhodococcus pyridinivorans]